MNINRDNYEIFFLDYFEGRLSSKDCTLLMAFLEDCPDLKEEFNQFEMVVLEPEPVVHFHGKASLKKNDTPNVNESNCSQWIIAQMEGELTSSQQTELEHFLRQNPKFQAEKELYIKTRLQPDLTITFPNKAELYRTAVVPLFRRKAVQIASVAASVALIASIYFISRNQMNFRNEFAHSGNHVQTETEQNSAKARKIIPSTNHTEQKLADNNSVQHNIVSQSDIVSHPKLHSVRTEAPKRMEAIALNEVTEEHNFYYSPSKRFEAISLNEMALMAYEETVPNIQNQMAQANPANPQSTTTGMGRILNRNGEASDLGNAVGKVAYENLYKANNFKETVVQSYLKLENTVVAFFGK